MGNSINTAAAFIVQTLFDLYIFIVLLRVMLQWLGANAFNPISQFIIKVTQPLVNPLRRILPLRRRIDWASIALLIVLELVKFGALIWLRVPTVPNFAGLFILALADIVAQIINVFFYAIILMVIVSWVNPASNNPAIGLIYRITDVILNPIRRIMPAIAGFDISPIPALIILKLLEILVVQPIMLFGVGLTFGGVQ